MILLLFGGMLCFVAYGVDQSDPTNLYLGVVLVLVVVISGGCCACRAVLGSLRAVLCCAVGAVPSVHVAWPLVGAAPLRQAASHFCPAHLPCYPFPRPRLPLLTSLLPLPPLPPLRRPALPRSHLWVLD